MSDRAIDRHANRESEMPARKRRYGITTTHHTTAQPLVSSRGHRASIATITTTTSTTTSPRPPPHLPKRLAFEFFFVFSLVCVYVYCFVLCTYAVRSLSGHENANRSIGVGQTTMVVDRVLSIRPAVASAATDCCGSVAEIHTYPNTQTKTEQSPKLVGEHEHARADNYTPVVRGAHCVHCTLASNVCNLFAMNVMMCVIV